MEIPRSGCVAGHSAHYVTCTGLGLGKRNSTKMHLQDFTQAGSSCILSTSTPTYHLFPGCRQLVRIALATGELTVHPG
jgi:hypothetical protein